MKRRGFCGLMVIAVHLGGVALPPGLTAQPVQETNSWEEKLSRGRLAYENMEFGLASRILKQIIEDISGNGRDPESIRVIAQAHLYLGMVVLAEGQESLAEEQFESACLLNPGLVLDPKFFSPRIISIFARAREKISSQPQIRLELETRPAGAEVYWDGRRLGKSPIFVEAWPGIHYLWAEKEGFPPRGRKLELKPGEVDKLLILLEQEKGEQPYPGVIPGTRPEKGWGWKKKSILIGGAIIIVGVVITSVWVSKGQGGEEEGETGTIFVRW